MSSIIIREVDNTTNALDEGVEVAFVPGFGALSAQSEEYLNKFTLFTSLAKFKDAMGSYPQTFATPFAYSADDWTQNACEQLGTSVMFEAGDPDPGYCYASGLLSAGIPVIYYMANKAPITTSEAVTAEVTFVENAAKNVAFVDNALDATRIVIDAKSETTNVTAKFTTVDYSTHKIMVDLTYTGTETAPTSVSIKYTYRSNVVDAADMYDAFCGSVTTPTIFEELKDRGTYNVKYITTGGYPIYEFKRDVYPEAIESAKISGGNTLVAEVLDVCAAQVSEEGAGENTGRGDCIALIDHTNYANRTLFDKGDTATSVFGCANRPSTDATESLLQFGDKLTFGAMFTPWCAYSIQGVTAGNIALPASYAYLTCLATSSRIYSSWNAVAGVARGTVSGITNILTTEILTNNIANKYQIETEGAAGVSINGITRVKPYGQVIWGNRTLQVADADKGVTALGFLNIRSMVCDIKKQVYTACKRYMFQENSAILWINFKAMITPLLDQMCSGHGLETYTIRRGAQSNKTKLFAYITLKPIYAVESFDITITLTDEDELSVTEEN